MLSSILILSIYKHRKYNIAAWNPMHSSKQTRPTYCDNLVSASSSYLPFDSFTCRAVSFQCCQLWLDSERHVSKSVRLNLNLNLKQTQVRTVTIQTSCTIESEWRSGNVYVPHELRMNLSTSAPYFVELLELHTVPLYTYGSCINSDCDHLQFVYPLPELKRLFDEAALRGLGHDSTRMLQVAVTKNATFMLKAVHVGKVLVLSRLQLDGYLKQNGSSLGLHIERRRIPPDSAFETSVLVVGILVQFCSGCYMGLKRVAFCIMNEVQLILLATVQQNVIIPLLLLGLTYVTELQRDIALGFMITFCMPSFAMASLFCNMMKGDLQLTCSLALITTFFAVGSAPLFLFVFNVLFGWQECDTYEVTPACNHNHTGLLQFGANSSHARPECAFEPTRLYAATAIANGCTVLVILCGSVLRKFSVALAEMLDNWLFKPLFLLYSILFATLGIIFNKYIFDLHEKGVFIIAMTVILISFVLSNLGGRVAGYDTLFIKSLASQSGMFNCFGALYVCRMALPQLEGELASIAPVWTLLLLPSPLVIFGTAKAGQYWLIDFIKRRREKQYRHTGLIGTLATMTSAMITLPFYHQAMKDHLPASPYAQHNRSSERGDFSKLIMQKSTVI